VFALLAALAAVMFLTTFLLKTNPVGGDRTVVIGE
jgi:hypothetical protein